MRLPISVGSSFLFLPEPVFCGPVPSSVEFEQEEDLRFDQEGFVIETTITGPTDNTTTLYLTKVTVTKGGKAYAEMQTYLTLTTPQK